MENLTVTIFEVLEQVWKTKVGNIDFKIAFKFSVRIQHTTSCLYHMIFDD